MDLFLDHAMAHLLAGAGALAAPNARDGKRLFAEGDPGCSGYAPYVIAKHALVGLTRSLSVDCDVASADCIERA
tara:strand:- start:516 stop:737 length:222 start_codon:yes stop_codon:yes gene_type:complete